MKTAFEKIKWLFFRWSRMQHPGEDIYRVKQFVQNKIFDRFFSYNKNGNGFVYNWSLTDLGNYIVDLKKYYSIFQVNIPLNYHDSLLEPKNKIRSTVNFKGKIDHKNFETVGENKYVFELNRLHILPALAYYTKQNAHDTSTIELLNTIVYSWIKQNPYLRSVNWKSGIEVAIRAFNFLTIRIFLANDESMSDACKKIDFTLQLHYQFLKKHLSLYSSANNHLIAELFGLVTISSVYNFKNAQEENTYYFDFFQKEIFKQTYDDGGSKEQSIHYHASILNASFMVLHFALSTKQKPLDAFLKRLKTMCIFLDEMTQGGKIDSVFGDKDDSNIVYDVFNKEFNLYQSLLYRGAKIFPDIKYSFFMKNNYKLDFTNALFPPTYQFFLPIAQPKTTGQYIYFKSSGYFIFKQHNKNNIRLYFDIGSLGYEPIAAHGHSDLLHFTLWINESPFIVDTGTYQYHNKFIEWRNYFRGIAAHNTVSVNEQSHAKSLGPMMWGKLNTSCVKSFGSDNWTAYCIGEHDAFDNENGGIKHRRKIEISQEKILIKDNLIGKGNYEIKFFLHFHPSIKAELDNNCLILTNEKNKVRLTNELFFNAQLFYGNKKEMLGWYSSSYDCVLPTYTLFVKKTVTDNEEILTDVFIN